MCVELGTSHQPGSCCIGPETPEPEHLVTAAQGPTVTKGRDCPVPAGLRRLHPHHRPASAPSPLLPGTEQPRPDRRAGEGTCSPWTLTSACSLPGTVLRTHTRDVCPHSLGQPCHSTFSAMATLPQLQELDTGPKLPRAHWGGAVNPCHGAHALCPSF